MSQLDPYMAADDLEEYVPRQYHDAAVEHAVDVTLGLANGSYKNAQAEIASRPLDAFLYIVKLITNQAHAWPADVIASAHAMMLHIAASAGISPSEALQHAGLDANLTPIEAAAIVTGVEPDQNMYQKWYALKKLYADKQKGLRALNYLMNIPFARQYPLEVRKTGARLSMELARAIEMEK